MGGNGGRACSDAAQGISNMGGTNQASMPRQIVSVFVCCGYSHDVHNPEAQKQHKGILTLWRLKCEVSFTRLRGKSPLPLYFQGLVDSLDVVGLLGLTIVTQPTTFFMVSLHHLPSGTFCIYALR